MVDAAVLRRGQLGGEAGVHGVVVEEIHQWGHERHLQKELYVLIIKEHKVPAKEKRMEIFAVRLKELRTEYKISQKDLAEKLGISDRAYRYYEEGKRYPDFQGLLMLADCFQVSLDYLVGRSDVRK